MITTNRNIFLGIHITPKLKNALLSEIYKRRQAKEEPEHVLSQSRVSYDLLRQALIAQGYDDLEHDEIL